MRYFFKLLDNVVVLPLMNDVARQPELWNLDKTRTAFEGTPHAQVDDILLRFGKPDGNDLEAADSALMKTLPKAKGLALNVMQIVGGSRLGRVVITKLEPGNKILPHADVNGAYAKYYMRYHLVLLGLSGSIFTCGDETVNMRTGELWWADVSQQHSVSNNSADDRVHLIVDVRIDP